MGMPKTLNNLSEKHKILHPKLGLSDGKLNPFVDN